MPLTLWLSLVATCLILTGFIVGALCERAWLNASAKVTAKENDNLREMLVFAQLEITGYRLLLQRGGRLNTKQLSRN